MIELTYFKFIRSAMLKKLSSLKEPTAVGQVSAEQVSSLSREMLEALVLSALRKSA